MRTVNVESSSTIRARRRFTWRLTLGLALSLSPCAPGVFAWQDEVSGLVVDTVEEAPPAIIEWPGVDRLAEALADSSRREDALLTVAAMLSLRSQSRVSTAEEAAERVAVLQGRREWLTRLASGYDIGEPRSPVLDPAAWQVQVQLDRVGLATTFTASPLGPGPDILLNQVFDQANPNLAAASLPELLWYLEVNAPMAWQGIVLRLQDDPLLGAALTAQVERWFDWPVPLESLPGEEAGDDEALADDTPDAAAEALLARARTSLGVSLAQTTGIGPPDPRRLIDVRRDLLVAMPGLGPGHRSHAAALLHLADVVDGLYRQEFLHVTETLLSITARLQDEAYFYPEQSRVFAAWLAQVLPPISAGFGRAFSAVDPQLNSVIATAYDITRVLSHEVDPDNLRELRVQIADAVAGLGLMIPDLGYYFDQPIRDPIAGGVDACTGIAGQVEADGSPAMTRELFDDCQETLVSLANFEARETQLAGSTNGPFERSQLQRELGLTAGQRINYGIGYLHERFETGCELPARPLPNPLEWAYLATFMSWFAEQSPVFFQAPANEARLERMRTIGRELVQEIAEQVDCLAGAGAVVNDPVDRVTTDYRTALRVLGQGLQGARADFRGARLAPGADIRLDAGADQSTAYRPVEMEIGPCDPDRACEMTGSLSSTRALLGLFEDPWLVADQSGLGALEICYDNMEWEDRRMEPVRPGDDNVANFHGRLAFDLRGRYRDGEDTVDLFAFRFTSPEESHYLFAAQREEVLADACPVEWIGSRIVTELPNGGGIVPNRLTYLSAARTLPSRLLEANWDQGAEWRDWFVTGLGVSTLELPEPPDITARLNQHLQMLYRQEQGTLYGALASIGGGERELSEELADVSTAKLLLRAQMMLFFPHILIHSDRLREAVSGQNGLLDRRLLNRARQQDLPVDDVLAAATERVELFREDWRSLPETVRRRGFIADSVSHAMVRLNAVHQQFFSAPEPPPVRSVPTLPGAEGESDQVGDAEQ